MNASLSVVAALLLTVGVMPAQAKLQADVHSPTPGVLCDDAVCANDKGISRALTEKYLGKKAAKNKLFSLRDADLTEFTFANGMFCDVKELLCREDRYYGENGQRTGAIAKEYTRLLFGE